MGLFGAFGKLGVQSTAKAIEDRRIAQIQAMKQSGIIKFAKDYAPNSEISSFLGQYEGLPSTFFRHPATEKEQNYVYELAARTLKKPEYQGLVGSCATYFVIANSLAGSLSDGLLACEKGIFVGPLFAKYIPTEEIETFDVDKKNWIFIKKKNDSEDYLSCMDHKKLKAEAEKFLNLFRTLYS